MSDELPARFRRRRVSGEMLERFSKLCDAIEARVVGGDDGRLAGLLAEWNSEARARYEASAFGSYAGAMSKAEFVRDALSPKAVRFEDLTFDEARDAVAAVLGGELRESESAHALRVLEANLPGSEISDLLYWPNVWFADESLLQVELSAEQTLAYACARSGRVLDGAPASVELPFPMPSR